MPLPGWILRARSVQTFLPGPAADALAIEGGRVVGVGEFSELRRVFADFAVEAVDGVAYPGLIDAHCHLLGLGRHLVEVSLTGAASEAEAADRLRGRPEGVVRGHGWDQNRWPGGGWPTRATLDAVCPGRPVFLTRVDVHAAWVNGPALALGGIDRDTPDPPGGRIVRDDSGNPTGVLVDAAMELVAARLPDLSPEDRRARLRAAAEHCAGLGVTAVHDAGMDGDTLDALFELDSAGELPVRVTAYERFGEPRFDAVLARGPLRQGRVALRGVKFFLDGALGSRGAWLFDDYSDDPGNRGLTLVELETLRREARRALDRGFQLALHAIGDAANARALDLFEALGQRERRHRLEHAQVMRPEDLERAGRLGVVASMQPAHCSSDLPWADARLGGRVRGAYAWRSLARAGATLAFGSDFPVEGPDPRAGLWAAVTRQSLDGLPEGAWQPQERLTLGEAWRAFSQGAAHAAFEDSDRGSLEPGMAADVTVLDRDLAGREVREILCATVVATVVDGSFTHRGSFRKQGPDAASQ